ncbi:hypothetical protein SSP24_15100 [Streptomyces spinoverrucosus]|uniref:Uncharacterized protein n=1 Tax=Streptomyces spinoverrucosus TaxID=284043 RepID=A0A4Y3VC48_9ACTN|nr:hypothetical protein SSP24_15100 [Streptomyces spinoverrucosus]
MQPSGSTRPAPAPVGVFLHTTAPLSRDAHSTYTYARLRRAEQPREASHCLRARRGVAILAAEHTSEPRAV